MTDLEPGDGEGPRSPYAYVGLGVEIVAPLVLFMFVGYLLDSWLGSMPWFLLVGALLGIAVGFYNLFRKFLPQVKGGPKP